MEILSWNMAYVVAIYIFVICPVHELGHYLMARAYGLKAKFRYIWNPPLFLATPAVEIKGIYTKTWKEASAFMAAGPLAGAIPLLIFQGMNWLPEGMFLPLFLGYWMGCTKDVAELFDIGIMRKEYGDLPLIEIEGLLHEKHKKEIQEVNNHGN